MRGCTARHRSRPPVGTWFASYIPCHSTPDRRRVTGVRPGRQPLQRRYPGCDRPDNNLFRSEPADKPRRSKDTKSSPRECQNNGARTRAERAYPPTAAPQPAAGARTHEPAAAPARSPRPASIQCRRLYRAGLPWGHELPEVSKRGHCQMADSVVDGTSISSPRLNDGKCAPTPSSASNSHAEPHGQNAGTEFAGKTTESKQWGLPALQQ